MRHAAWALGLAGALACAAAGGVVITLGAPLTMLFIYLVGILLGLLGALIASREPGNGIGWLMCATALMASLVHLPSGYGYAALVLTNGSWPLGSTAVWLGSWAWATVFMFMPLISNRFPDGKVRPGWWHLIDWLAIGGALLFAAAIALRPTADLLGFLPLPESRVVELARHAQSPIALAISNQLLNQVQLTGLALMLAGFIGSAASVIARFRRAHNDVRLQLKWFTYGGALIAIAFLYGAVAWNIFGQPLYAALTPLEIASLAWPVAISVAILRYRLYDIDLIINRTLVYAGLTAMLAAGYTASVTLIQRLFISVSGQKSDAAYVLSAFAIVVAFSPLKDWLQHQVDRRLGRARASAALDQFTAGVEAVVSVIDVHRIACRFLDEAMSAFDARGAAVYLESTEPIYDRGRLGGGPRLEVPIRHGERQFGRLVLAERRGHLVYAERDRAALQKSADSVGEAMALIAYLRHGLSRSGEDAR